jgi:hypothetical protein
MDGTILGQGSFKSPFAGANPNPGSASNAAADAVLIQIPSGADWLYVRDYTQAGANGNSGAYFQGTANAYLGNFWYWQRGMAAGTGIVQYKANSSSALQEDALLTGGFTLYDPSGQTAGAVPVMGSPVAYTGISNVVRPIVTTGSTAGLVSGVSIVRLSLLSGDTALAADVSGIDFLIDTVVASTSFRLANAFANAPGLTTGTGHYRIINFDPLFYPRRRYVVNISQAASGGVVQTNVPHQYIPGQAVRFTIPAISGMTQLNSSAANNYLYAIVTAISATDPCQFTINIDTSAFTAFTWPTQAQQPSAFPEVAPVGEDSATSLSSPTIQVPGVLSATAGAQIFNTNTGLLADSTVNTGFLGMLLGGGGNGNALTTPITGPSGSVHFTSANVIDVADQMYWVAGKSTYGGL